MSEECGRTWSKEVKKKALKALERWPPDIGNRTESPKRGKSKKRLQRSALGKEEREGSSEVLKKWLQKERKGLEAQNTCLGPGDKLTQGKSSMESETSEASALGPAKSASSLV